jgi:hypothetical protein
MKEQCRNYWKANQKEGEGKGRLRLRWMDGVRLDLRNVA